MWKKILIIQSVACLIIYGLFSMASQSDNPVCKKSTDKIVSAISTHYTIKDITDKGIRCAEAVTGIPAAVAGAVISSDDEQKFGYPKDKGEAGQTVSVYAVCAGRILETGRNDEYGRYIKIQHEDAVTVYGNCSNIYIKQGGFVRKGQVIAGYVEDEKVPFIYEKIQQ